jgi:3'-phosphoadenosine 5'-phosphosulfate sulfotransferase (PAPS reductase)/FAD synthetase
VRHIISLGAGVQSSTMALMAACGEITPMPECAIFADTGREPSAVYRWLDWLEPRLPFRVHRVRQGDLGAAIGVKPNGVHAYMPLPAFVQGNDGREALLNRSCTRDFKIRPIRRKVRELVGLTRKRSPKEAVVQQWIGISTDEVQRAKLSREPGAPTAGRSSSCASRACSASSG